MADTVRYIADPPRSAELVIIGGGIVGAATAFQASRAGLRPVLLERRTALCTLTTPASTGAFRLQFDNREELELVRESLDLLSNFSEVTGQTRYDPRLQRQGYLWCTTDAARAGWQRDLVRKQHTWGQSDIEHLDGEEVRRRFGVGRSLRRKEGFTVATGMYSDQCGRAAPPSEAPKRPVLTMALRNNSWLTCRIDQRPSAMGIPHMNAVRVAASSGVRPRLTRRR